MASPVPPASAPVTQPPAANSLRIQPVERPSTQPLRPTRDLRYLLEDDEPPKSRIASVIVVISLLALGAFAWRELRPMLQTETATSAKTSTVPSPDAASKVASDIPQSVQKSEPVESPQLTPPADAVPSTVTGDSVTKTETAEEKQSSDEGVPPAPSIDETQKQETRPNTPALQASVEAPTRSRAVSKPPSALSKPTSKAPAPDVVKQAEAYLYGRGVPQNCERALSMLKGEADKSNARARSALGSMYATGHCVSRDLPTAYRYFALVLRTDPENGVASQNLENLWKQMTPPERQAATRQ